MDTLDEKLFIDTSEHPKARLVTLSNRESTVQLTNYGARLVSFVLKNEVDVVLGFDTLRKYIEAREKYHGAVVGRVCQRIGGASFTLEGTYYHLASNDVYGKPIRNHLHGGFSALHNRFWETTTGRDDAGNEYAEFSTFSPDGEQGYPSNVTVCVRYTLDSERDRLVATIHAHVDAPTPLNITLHPFFNLAGHHRQMSAQDHLLTIYSNALVESDSELLPTGRFLPTHNQWFDFTLPRSIGDAIANADPQTRQQGGFSLTYDLGNNLSRECRLVARLEDPISGRSLDIHSDQDSLQLYNGYFMDGSDIGKKGIPYGACAGIAIEPQGFPDAPNRPEFTSVIVTPERPYFHRTEFHFNTK